MTQEQRLEGLTSITVVDQQVRPQTPLFEGSHGCGRGGEDLRHGDVEAQPLELGHERLPGRLALVSAEAQLQARGPEPVEVALNESRAERHFATTYDARDKSTATQT